MSSVLFEAGSWRICRTVNNRNKERSVIHHFCGDNCHDEWWRSSGPVGAGSTYRCLYCWARVPDEIYGLWILHEWDR